MPRAQRRPLAKPLTEYAALYSDRDEAILAGYASGGYTLKQLGKCFDLHYSRISRIMCRAKEAKGKTLAFLVQPPSGETPENHELRRLESPSLTAETAVSRSA